jgi:hypothetical protein
MGPVAYQLSLTSHSKIHSVFQVPFLEKVIGTRCQNQTNLLELDVEVSIWIQPQVLLDQRECHIHQCTIN